MARDWRRANGACCLAGLGCVAVAEGRWDDARECLVDGVEVGDKLGSLVGVVESLEGLAILAAGEHRCEQAIAFVCAAAAQRAAVEHPRSPAEHEFLERWLAPARRILGEDAPAAACSAGAALSNEEAIARARAQRRL